MALVRFSPDARLDLLSIRLYLEGVNLTASRRYERLFQAAFDQLAKYPLSGRARPDLQGEQTRSWPVRPYVILYEMNENVVEILRVVHGARDLPKLPMRDPGRED